MYLHEHLVLLLVIPSRILPWKVCSCHVALLSVGEKTKWKVEAMRVEILENLRNRINFDTQLAFNVDALALSLRETFVRESMFDICQNELCHNRKRTRKSINLLLKKTVIRVDAMFRPNPIFQT